MCWWFSQSDLSSLSSLQINISYSWYNGCVKECLTWGEERGLSEERQISVRREEVQVPEQVEVSEEEEDFQSPPKPESRPAVLEVQVRGQQVQVILAWRLQTSHRRWEGGREGERERESWVDGLYLADLDEECRKADLERVFMKYGPLKEIWLASYAPFYAFIVFRNRLDAQVRIWGRGRDLASKVALTSGCLHWGWRSQDRGAESQSVSRSTQEQR